MDCRFPAVVETLRAAVGVGDRIARIQPAIGTVNFTGLTESWVPDSHARVLDLVMNRAAEHVKTAALRVGIEIQIVGAQATLPEQAMLIGPRGAHDLLTLDETARMLGTSPAMAQRSLERGQLPGHVQWNGYDYFELPAIANFSSRKSELSH